MVDLSSNVARREPAAGPVAFEQPLNERMRTFLRIELLQSQVLFHARDASEFGTRSAVTSLLEILAITGRGDIRADVLKELDRHAERLAQYRRSPGVDRARLSSLMQEIDTLRARLIEAGKHYLATLRESEFLNAIRHRSAIPGGTCVFDLPEYGYWLQLPSAERARQLDAWIGQLEPLYDAIAQVLWLTREATVPRECIAPAGFYQHSLGKDEPFSLVRVLVGADTGLFPEISAGQHRFTIRFEEWAGVDDRARQTASDVRFLLALC